MGAEAALAAILILYILGTLGYTGYLVFSLWDPGRRNLAIGKLFVALLIALCASGWAAMWWQHNFQGHSIIKILVFVFLPALGIGTIMGEIFFRLGGLYAKIRRPEA